jgi:hypothetical protein
MNAVLLSILVIASRAESTLHRRTVDRESIAGPSTQGYTAEPFAIPQILEVDQL